MRYDDRYIIHPYIGFPTPWSINIYICIYIYMHTSPSLHAGMYVDSEAIVNAKEVIGELKKLEEQIQKLDQRAQTYSEYHGLFKEGGPVGRRGY
jgi:hypothetical protein